MHNEKDTKVAGNKSVNQDSGSTSQPISNAADLSASKILLWDIDGTLLQSNRPGSFKKYFGTTLEKIFGTQGKIDEVKAAGATDKQIVFKALEGDGVTLEQISAQMSEFIHVLGVEMENYVNSQKNVYEILPGVKEILQATSENPHFVNALLTGNVSCGAEIKCRYVGIWQYFEKSLNTYGDISHDRRQLAVAAGKSFNQHFQFELKPSQFIVIGDTPHDIVTAKNFGAKVISVETGRGIEPADLKAESPNFIVTNLSNTKRILEILENF